MSVYEIQPRVSFKPYENVRGWYKPKKRDPEIPGSCEHIGVFLRRQVLLYGMTGYIDVVNEHPWSGFLEHFFSKNRFSDFAKPLGETFFYATMPNDQEVTFQNMPASLRVSFLPRNPGDYAKLLNSWVNVELGQTEYLMGWNYSRPTVRTNLQLLEAGQNPIIVERNLFNMEKLKQALEGEKEEERKPTEEPETEIGRITFIWLPLKRSKLRTIKMTFDNMFDDFDDGLPTLDPPTLRKGSPVPVLS